MVATISWDNKVDEKFARVLKTKIKVLRAEGSESRRKRSVESREVDLSQTRITFPLTELGWGSRVSLQVVLGDQAGPETEELVVFTEEIRGLYLAPLTDIQVSVMSDTLNINTPIKQEKTQTIMDLI